MLLFPYIFIFHFAFIVANLSPCPEFPFFANVIVSCISFPNAPFGQPYLQVVAKNMKDYNLINDPKNFSINIRFSTPNVETIIMLDPVKYNPNDVVGVAMDGVPLYSSLVDIGIDGLAPDASTGATPLLLDQCGGVYQSTGTVAEGNVADRYHYRAMPACILDTHNTYNKRRTVVGDVYQLLDAFTDHPGASIIGVSTSGECDCTLLYLSPFMLT